MLALLWLDKKGRLEIVVGQILEEQPVELDKIFLTFRIPDECP
jgi:hypothetical protein